MSHGYVSLDSDGEVQSAVPEGIRDLAKIGADLELSPEVEEKLHQLWEEAGSYSELKAKYKLEVAFTEERSIHRPFGGFIMVWSNGGYAHGGGDEVVYFCTSKVDDGGATKQCNFPLDLKWIGKERAVCPKCKNVIEVGQLMGQIYAKLSHQNWAALITRVFQALGCDADIRLGILGGDLRAAATQEQEREHRGEKLTKVRLDRRWVLYSLPSIAQDTSTGSSLYSRIRAFLGA